MALKFKVPSVPKIKNPISTLKNTASNVGKTVNKIASNPVVKTVTAPNRAVINADAAIAKGAVGVAKDVGLLKSKTTPTTLGASPISGTGLGAIGVSTGSGAKTTYTPPPVRTGAKTTATSKTQEQAQQEGIAQGLTGANLQRYVESSVFGTPSTQQGNTQATFSINDLRTPSDVPTNTGSLNATLNNPSASNISDLQKQYLALMQPNADEQNLADRLAALDESTNLGISGMEGQGRGIPREVIQGKQRLLAEQAGIEKQSLIDRLANATAQRQASAQALGAQLNFETQRQQQEQSQMQPFMFGQDLVRYNPSTGQIETVAQGVQQAASPLTLSPGETLYDPNTGQAIYTAPSSGASNGFSLSPGQTRYDQFGNVIASAPGGTGAAGSYTAQQAKDIGFYNRASSAEQNVQAALEGGVGGLLIQSALPNFAQSKDYQQYRQAAETWIKAVLRQESGAAIPPEEMNSYMKTYFPQPGDRQETVAQKQQARQDAMNALTVNVPSSAVSSSGGDSIDQFLNSFSSAPSTALNGSIAKFKGAIAKQESGGNYGAIGPATSKGNRAYGKYQVMDFNIPSWTQQALGYSMTPQQYLNSPQAQEAVADYKFGQLYNQYGNWGDVASVWFSGRPLAQAGNSSDVTGTTVPHYVNNILSFMG